MHFEEDHQCPGGALCPVGAVCPGGYTGLEGRCRTCWMVGAYIGPT